MYASKIEKYGSAAALYKHEDLSEHDFHKITFV